jgi:hypothetical protein
MGWSGNLHGKRRSVSNKIGVTRREALAFTAAGLAVAAAPGVGRAAGPQGQLTWGVHISLAPTWFDPAETPGIITPFMVMYALHDAVVKPMPGNPLAPCLAEPFVWRGPRNHGAGLGVRVAAGCDTNGAALGCVTRGSLRHEPVSGQDQPENGILVGPILPMELADNIQDGAGSIDPDRAGPAYLLAHRLHPASGQFREPGTAGIEPVEPQYGNAAGSLVPGLKQSHELFASEG